MSYGETAIVAIPRAFRRRGMVVIVGVTDAGTMLLVVLVAKEMFQFDGSVKTEGLGAENE